MAKERRKRVLQVRSRREQDSRGSKGNSRRRLSTRRRSQEGKREEGRGLSIRNERRRSWRTGCEDKEAKSSRKHRAIRCDRRVRKMKGTPKIEKEVSNLRGTGNRMTPRMTPSAKSRPLILIIYTSGRPSGEGKSWRATLAEKPKWCADRW